MSEPTLNLNRTAHRGEIADYLGWGLTATDWDDEQVLRVDNLLKSAQRKFYFHAQLKPDDPVHVWTFLKPVGRIQLTAGLPTASVPDDFGGFEGLGTISLDGTSSGYWPIQQYAEEQIRAAYAGAPTAGGRPLMYAEQQVKGTYPAGSERHRCWVYPLPDQNYVLSAPYRILADAITASRPFPYGGAAHAETMLAACRAVAELYQDKLVGTENQNYLQLLSASISTDRLHQPKTLGLNRDMSDWFQHNRWGGRWPDGLWHPLGIGWLGTASY